MFKHVLKLCFIQQNRVNQDVLHVHKDLKMGERFAFATHLSQKIKDFAMEQLRLGLTVSQLIAKHRGDVKNIMLRTCELNINMFFTKQDVKALSGKLVQKHTNYIRTMQKVCVCGFNKILI